MHRAGLSRDDVMTMLALPIHAVSGVKGWSVPEGIVEGPQALEGDVNEACGIILEKLCGSRRARHIHVWRVRVWAFTQLTFESG
jgi:hypothetical protein